jgi:hypothetical protein
MGFAKYQEDNYSRYHGTSIVRRNEHDRFAPEGDTNKSTNEGSQKKMNTSKLKDFTVAEARPPGHRPCRRQWQHVGRWED